jgi:hypothetical protein
MSFPENSKRGRIKGVGGATVVVRRHKSDKYNSYYDLKDKSRKKVDKGQCRLTIPRSIADSMGLKDRDFIEFIAHQRNSYIIRKVEKDELE